jgi:hypothetical protein
MNIIWAIWLGVVVLWLAEEMVRAWKRRKA